MRICLFLVCITLLIGSIEALGKLQSVAVKVMLFNLIAYKRNGLTCFKGKLLCNSKPSPKVRVKVGNIFRAR